MSEIQYPYRYYPMLIHMTKEIDELFKSNEAKHHLGQVRGACERLQGFMDRELKGQYGELFAKTALTEPHTATRIRHEVLHRCFDELLACYIEQIKPLQPTKSILDTTLHEFMQWSHQMTIEATCEEADTDGNQETEGS